MVWRNSIWRLKGLKTLLQGNVDAIYFNEKLYIGKREEVFVYNESTGNFDLFYHLAGKNITLSCLHLDKNKKSVVGDYQQWHILPVGR